MSDLQFEDSNVNSISARRAKFKSTKKTFAERLVDWGLAKDTDRARLYLIGFIVICFGLIIYINMKTFSSPAPVEITDDAMLGTEAGI
jgi:hypothetical protein